MSAQKNIVIKSYTGNSESAADDFQRDSIKMGEKGYYPISQSWTPGSYGCGAFIVALLLCFVFIGFLVFVYMLIVKPEGTLTVTYELRSTPAVKELSFFGSPELSNDSYLLFLTKKFDIQKNDVLGKYALNERLYGSIDEALSSAHQLYENELAAAKLEQERIAERNEINRVNLKAREKMYSKIILGGAGIVFIGFIGYAVVQQLQTSGFGFSSNRESSAATKFPISPSFDCAKSNSTAEKLICSDSELAAKDNELHSLYIAAKAKASDPAAFKADTTTTWKWRERNCLDKQCLLGWYTSRTSYYQGVIDYSQFSQESKDLIRQWLDSVRADTVNNWGDDSIKRSLNQQGICFGKSEQSRAEYNWHKCTPTSFKY